ncbi:cation transporter, partial [Micrococcus sp. SIMBA_144]
IVAFVIPEVFSMDMSDAEAISLSTGISIILIVLYLAALFFKLVTHRGVYQHVSNQEESDGGGQHVHEEAEWSRKKAMVVLALSTAAVA